jgi:glycosyltransferase involved in cell wall biosynthesis
MTTPEISLVIPVYNEEDNLFPLYERIVEVLDPEGIEFEVILVDDGSRDRSLQKLRELVDRDPRIVAVNLRRNFGQTAAMAAGIDQAKGVFVVTLDADLQNDPADIPAMLARAKEGFDIVSGWRKERKDAFISRTLPSMIANRIISTITGTFLHDYGCTLKVYRREALQGLRLYGEMHRFLPALVARHGANILEMKVSHHARLHGESKYGIGRTFKVILDLLTVKFLTSYSTKPIYVFGGIGMFMFMAGFLAAMVMIYAKLVHGISMILTPLPNLSAMLVILGMQSLMLGLLAELVIRTYHESQDKKIYVVRETYQQLHAPD